VNEAANRFYRLKKTEIEDEDKNDNPMDVARWTYGVDHGRFATIIARPR
jgi:hypothetical protein